MRPTLNRTFLMTATAALFAAGCGATAVSAADYDGVYRNSAYRSAYQSRDADVTPAARRHVPDDFDEDNDHSYSRHRDRKGWGDTWQGYGHHNVQRVEARASYASDYLPFYVKEWRAKRSAIEAWKAKVSNRYGEQFAHWRIANNTQVNCDAGAGSVYCTVSARPVAGGTRWGWNDSR